MATALRPVGHEERLTLVGHLEELRTRLIICVIALAVTTGFCYWQNGRVLDILNKPLETKEQADSSKRSGDPLEQQARFSRLQKQAYEDTASFLESLSAADLTPGQVKLRAKAIESQRAAAAGVPRDVASNPITLGVTEPFTQTISVSFYAGLLLALPILLYQLYAFLIPAFTPSERKVAVPIMALVPVLFIAGLAFGYFVVLERAIAFLQNFNDDNFDILVQASTYYKFCLLFLGAIGMLFQIPVAVLAVTRTGILTPRQLRKHRGYAILAIAVVAAVATPTPDPLTMTLAMAPLIVLYELSILLALWLDRVRPRRASRWSLDDDDETTWTSPATIPTGSRSTDRRSRAAPMLFDLRGRGRRRTVQVIYLSLAILMGGGLVLFGIGGATSGGLFDAFSGDNANKSSGTEALERTATTAQAATERNPQDAAAWASLVKARFQLAGTNDGVDQNTGAFTAAGKRRLRSVEQAWDRYVALDPNPPDDTVAGYMVQAFSSSGLDKPEKAVRAMEMVIENRGENSNLYSQLAVLAYQAGQGRKGDLAADKAVSLAAPADRKLLRQNLDQAKTQAAAAEASNAATTPVPTTVTGTTSTTG